MPLHLLGKKSWNVYNPENIARVRRDEVQAKAREEEQERRMQEVDAERRIQILRGERPSSPPPPPSPLLPVVRSDRKPHATDIGRTRKRRRLAGENDTDRDIRFAREDAQLALAKRGELATTRTSDAPLHDSAGHINLFPSEETQRSAVKNAEAEKESADLQRKYEDQYTMRFSNAAGFRQSVGQTPWYSASGSDAMAPDPVSGKDVWGNEDPMRRERERVRMDADDPLGAMRKGVRHLKSVEQERKKWNEEKRRQLEELKLAEKYRSRNRRKESASEDSHDDFRLDSPPDTNREDQDRRSHRHRQHGRNRSRDRSHRRKNDSKSRSHRHDRHRHGRCDHRRHRANDS
ncbi:uncharacterized protein ATNIH1004_007801 [Aspergillus tanneri]|uniref:CBF1-interacting co-repressor CIR N-terminal domain-containing protein n=1 Tax=Aspergillus tanneri TaxID=1220188 RepID=A0A5M9MHB6_9EURO|nr:uncharacterized protein ATNIH1004_007801 [Aspergillus tanneri]KAA8646371.1 hypothetical protein ATNIH1004_007801 [Aspergillus tanneri]